LNNRSTIYKNRFIKSGMCMPTYYDIYRLEGTNISPEKVANYVSKNATSGEIILIHFNKPDIEALPLICDQIKEKGLEITTVSDLLESN